MTSRKFGSNKKGGAWIGRDKIAAAFGRVLRGLRNEQGISQEDLAKMADFDRTYPSLLERGMRSPTINVVVKLANILAVESPGALLDAAVYEMANNRLPSPNVRGKR